MSFTACRGAKDDARVTQLSVRYKLMTRTNTEASKKAMKACMIAETTVWKIILRVVLIDWSPAPRKTATITAMGRI